jgi:FHA domain
VSEQGGSDQDGSHGHAPGLFPVPGDGVLARRGDLILLCSLEESQAADGLLDLLEQIAAAGGDGREFTDAIADALEFPVSGPSVLAFGPAGSGLAVTVSGAAWADLSTAGGTARIESGHPSVLLRAAVRSPVSGVRGGLSRADNGVASTDRFSRLDAGTVRAGGLSYYAVGQPSGQPHPAGDVAGGGKRRGPEPGQAAAVPDTQMPPDISAAETSAMEIPRAEARGAAEASVAESPPPPTPSASFEPSAALAGTPPAGQSEAQERQATQIWSDPAVEREASAPPGAATEPPEAYQPQVDEPAAPAQPFEAVLLLNAGPGGADAPVREPLPKVKDMPPGSTSYVSVGPLIQGVYCKNGHFDDPEALFCAICGISMNQQTLVPRPGERPPLGVLLLDDGSVFQLDSDYVVGREPSLDASVAEGKARPLRISDETGIVSRVHARVHLEGWRVLVTDLGSANGTRVLLPGQQADQPLAPQVPIVLATGSQVDLGGRGFRYESHRGR